MSLEALSVDLLRELESHMSMCDRASLRRSCKSVHTALSPWTCRDVVVASRRCAWWSHPSQQFLGQRCIVDGCRHPRITHLVSSFNFGGIGPRASVRLSNDQFLVKFIPYCEIHQEAQLFEHVDVFCMGFHSAGVS